MLVSVTDVRAYLGGVAIPEGMTNVLEDIIARTQKMVETILNRPVERVQVREVVRSDSKGYLYLSVTPVWKMISCGGTTVPNAVNTDTPYAIVPDASLGSDPRIIDKVSATVPKSAYPYFDVMVGNRYYAGLPHRNYIVEYIGGLNPDDIDDIKRVVIQVSAREWSGTNVPGAGLSVGNPDQTDHPDNRGLSVSDDELKMISRYRRRIAL